MITLNPKAASSRIVGAHEGAEKRTSIEYAKLIAMPSATKIADGICHVRFVNCLRSSVASVYSACQDDGSID
jgi:hypothetical protein